MLYLTGFSDEISQDLQEQLEGLKKLGIRHMELRGVWGKNVLELTKEDMVKVKNLLSEYGIRVSSIASPIGKYPVQNDFSPQKQAMQRAIELCKQLNIKYIRIFSYFIPEGENPDDYQDEVISRMLRLAVLAEEGGVTIILENDNGGLFGDIDERVLQIVQAVDSPALRLAFDPGNFIFAGVAAGEAYDKLKHFIEYIHIKDADKVNYCFTEAGTGDGELRELLRDLDQSAFSGFLSIEPHLHKKYPDASNFERFTIATKALKLLLDEQHLYWN